MSVSPSPSHLISLGDVAERRVWCPASGSREQSSVGGFAPDAACIGPRCAVWEWRGAGDVAGGEQRRCHLVPPHFSPGYRLRLASQVMPELVKPLGILAEGGGDGDVARADILGWAEANWRPEQDLPVPGSWERRSEVFWDTGTDTAAVDLARVLSEDQRAGYCGLKGTGHGGGRRLELETDIPDATS